MAVSLRRLMRRRTPAQKRLFRMRPGGAPAGKAARRSGRLNVIGVLSRVASKLISAEKLTRYRTQLAGLGRPVERDLARLLAVKLLLLPVGLYVGTKLAALAVPFAGDLVTLPLTVLFTILAFLLPDKWLKRRVAKHQRAVLRAMPDALDLLSITLTAGLGFQGALGEVVRRFDNAVSRELGLVLRDVSLGRSRRDALAALAGRVRVDEVASLVAAVQQAEELGSPLKDALRQQAAVQRAQWKRQAEEGARKASVLILLPMLFFILPALLLVLFGPVLPAFSALGSMGA